MKNTEKKFEFGNYYYTSYRFPLFWERFNYRSEINTHDAHMRLTARGDHQWTVRRRAPKTREVFNRDLDPEGRTIYFLKNIDEEDFPLKIPPKVWECAFRSPRTPIPSRGATELNWRLFPDSIFKIILYSARERWILKAPITLLLLLGQENYGLNALYKKNGSAFEFVERYWEEIFCMSEEIKKAEKEASRHTSMIEMKLNILITRHALNLVRHYLQESMNDSTTSYEIEKYVEEYWALEIEDRPSPLTMKRGFNLKIPTEYPRVPHQSTDHFLGKKFTWKPIFLNDRMREFREKWKPITEKDPRIFTTTKDYTINTEFFSNKYHGMEEKDEEYTLIDESDKPHEFFDASKFTGMHRVLDLKQIDLSGFRTFLDLNDETFHYKLYDARTIIHNFTNHGAISKRPVKPRTIAKSTILLERQLLKPEFHAMRAARLMYQNFKPEMHYFACDMPTLYYPFEQTFTTGACCTWTKNQDYKREDFDELIRGVKPRARNFLLSQLSPEKEALHSGVAKLLVNMDIPEHQKVSEFLYPYFRWGFIPFEMLDPHDKGRIKQFFINYASGFDARVNSLHTLGLLLLLRNDVNADLLRVEHQVSLDRVDLEAVRALFWNEIPRVLQIIQEYLRYVLHFRELLLFNIDLEVEHLLGHLEMLQFFDSQEFFLHLKAAYSWGSDDSGKTGWYPVIEKRFEAAKKVLGGEWDIPGHPVREMLFFEDLLKKDPELAQIAFKMHQEKQKQG